MMWLATRRASHSVHGVEACQRSTATPSMIRCVAAIARTYSSPVVVFVVVITVLPSGWFARRTEDQFGPEFATPEVGRHEEKFPGSATGCPDGAASRDCESVPNLARLCRTAKAAAADRLSAPILFRINVT
jgi:hypothetical protein